MTVDERIQQFLPAAIQGADPEQLVLLAIAILEKAGVSSDDLHKVREACQPVLSAPRPRNDLLSIYRRIMRPSFDLTAAGAKFVVRLYDGMDSCWCDCTGPVSIEEALRAWAKETKGGTKRVAFAEIDYYAIFPADTRMLFNSESCDR